MKSSICEYVSAHHTGIPDTFDEPHSMPEPALHEVRIADYLKTQLKQAGFDVKGDFAKMAALGIRDTGIDGPVVGIGADMDALCYEKEGKTVYIYSYGHDANCTAVLWTAKASLETGQLKARSLKVLPRPAKETLQGVKAVIESRVLEDIQYLVNTHLRPQEELPMGQASPVALHRASEHTRVKVYGHEAHRTKPHQRVNAILTVSVAISTVNVPPFNPLVPHSIKPTKVSSSSNPFNTIPNYTEVIPDIQAQANEVMRQIRESLAEAAATNVESTGAKALAEWLGGMPTASRRDELIEIALEAIREFLGEDALGPIVITPGDEGFHNYLLVISGLRTTVLGIGTGLEPGLHMSDVTFDTNAVFNAIIAIGSMVANIHKSNL